MSNKFTKIKDLYPDNYNNFYTPIAKKESTSKISTKSEQHDDLSIDLDLHDPSRESFDEDQSIKNDVKEKTNIQESKKEQTGIVDKIQITIRQNLINIVVLLIGYFLVSHDTVVSFIVENVSDNNLTSIALRGLGLIVVFLGAKLLLGIFVPSRLASPRKFNF